MLKSLFLLFPNKTDLTVSLRAYPPAAMLFYILTLPAFSLICLLMFKSLSHSKKIVLSFNNFPFFSLQK